MKQNKHVLYQSIVTESDEFATGELIETIASRLRSKNTGFQAGEVYIVVSCMRRWARFKLTMGKKEIEYAVSDTEPKGEAWKKDFLYEIHPIASKKFGRIQAMLRSYGSQRASGYYFRKASDSVANESKKLVNMYIHDLTELLQHGNLRGIFETHSETLKITEKQYMSHNTH